MDARYLRCEPQARLLRVDTPVVALVPLAVLHSASCCVLYTSALEKSAPVMSDPVRSLLRGHRIEG